MCYFTLDGIFSSLFGYHFILVNHFHHKKVISFSFYFLTSLEYEIKEHRKNYKLPILHEGLIMLIMEYMKSFSIPIEPNKASQNCKIYHPYRVHYSYMSTNIEGKMEEEEWIVEEGDGDSLEIYSNPPKEKK